MFLANKLNKGGSLSSPDAQFNYVTMLLHGDGTNGAQNNTFLDSSTNNFTITRNGNTTQGSFSPYGSNWSVSNNGVGGNYLTVAANSALNQSGNLTIEMWVYLNATPALTLSLYGFEVTNFLKVAINSARKLVVDQANVGERIVSTNAISLGTWAHICLVRNGSSSNNCSIYINGSLEGQFTDTSTATASGTGIILAKTDEPATRALNGYVSNLRVTNTAVYTGAFTPSTTPLTAVSGTQLLTCQGNRFIDNSANNFTIGVTGTAPSVQRFNPFGASTAYSTSVIGGSGYFDGSGDYLTSSCGNVGTGDFTIEGWFYFRTTPSTMGLFQASSTSGGFAPNQSANLAVATGSSSTWQIYAKNTYTISSSTSVPVNAWGHMALVRSGTTTVLYINGVAVITLTSDSTNYSTSYIGLGGIYDNSSYLLNGYLSNFRVVVGTAVYTSAFTPPTSPVTAISGTALLGNFTNGAIFDNAMMNDLETVGNAQISTSVVKYGTGSLKFDGTGDYLQAPDSPVFNLGSGNWTIESWIYINSAKNYNGFYGKRQAGQFGLALQIDSSGVLSISASITGSSWALGGASLGSGYTTGTWMHVAVTRSGTTITGWLNGTSTGTQTLSGAIFSSTGYPATIGSANDSGQELNGYMDDFRITNGYARYTTTFTPPTKALSDTGP